MLESADGKALSVSKGMLSRQSTQGSVATINSFESSAGAAFGRIEKGKGVRGLVVEFYDAGGMFSPFPLSVRLNRSITFP
jgi:hypothetical protein